MEQALAYLLELAVLSVVVHQKQGEVLLVVLRVRLTVDHCVAELLVDSLREHVHALTLHLLLTLVLEQNFRRLYLGDFKLAGQALHLCLMVAHHFLKHSQVPTQGRQVKY